MVMINGIAANLVAMPPIISIEQNTSAKTVRAKANSGVNPNKPGNCTGCPENSISSLGSPWVSIKKPMETRAIKIARCVLSELWLMDNNFFMCIYLFVFICLDDAELFNIVDYCTNSPSASILTSSLIIGGGKPLPRLKSDRLITPVALKPVVFCLLIGLTTDPL